MSEFNENLIPFSAYSVLQTDAIGNPASSITIVDDVNVPSIDYADRVLFDPTEVEALEWNTRTMLDSTGITSLDWANRALFDPSNLLSLDWVNRQLHSTTQPMLDWSGASVSFLVDLSIDTVGKGLKIAEGSNARLGTSAMSGGTVVVANTSVTSTTRIFLTKQESGTPVALGSVRVSARTAGTSFTISSDNVLDTSTVAWMLVEPA